jgi:Mn2+/Fe2+ NRAMP family transporter
MTIMKNTTNQTATKGIKVQNKWLSKLIQFLMVMGPGFIVMIADNDAGAVSTYVQAGANYGLHFMWLLL